MESAMFFLGIIMVIVCSFSLSLALLLYFRTKKDLHLYLCLLLASYLIELVELLYIARFCLPEDTRYFNLIHFPVLRIFTTVSVLLLHLLILLRILGLRFYKRYLLLFAAVALFCAYIAWLPQTLLTIWLFYLPRQIFHFGYGILFLVRRIVEKDEAARRRIEHNSFLVLGVFLLSVSILLEDSLLISHIQTYFTDMLSVTERNFSENILWLFLMLYSAVYCVRELGHGSASGHMEELAEEYKFTPREMQILKGILQYKTTAEICEELNISVGTVKTHTHNIYMKANVKSRQELIRALMEEGQTVPQKQDQEETWQKNRDFFG